MLISFRVDGNPVSHQHRQTKSGVIYLKPTVREWQKVVGFAARAVSIRGSALSTYTGPVSIIAEFHMPIPKSQKKHYKHGDAHLQDPDSTNLWKAVEDGIKRILFADDNQVWKVSITKIWSDTPGVELRIHLEEL